MAFCYLTVKIPTPLHFLTLIHLFPSSISHVSHFSISKFDATDTQMKMPWIWCLNAIIPPPSPPPPPSMLCCEGGSLRETLAFNRICSHLEFLSGTSHRCESVHSHHPNLQICFSPLHSPPLQSHPPPLFLELSSLFLSCFPSLYLSTSWSTLQWCSWNGEKWQPEFEIMHAQVWPKKRPVNALKTGI